jgi:hypothetical protein
MDDLDAIPSSCCDRLIVVVSQEKTGQVMGAAKDKAYEAKDRAAGMAGHASGQGQGATEAAKQKAGEAKDKTSETAQAAKDKAAGTAQAAKDKTVEGKDQTGSFLGEKTELAKQKAAETAQYAQDRTYDAAQYAKDSAVAGKDKTGSVLQQATETVKGAVVGAKDAVVNTLGMGGDNTGSAATKDTSSVTEKITGDH